LIALLLGIVVGAVLGLTGAGGSVLAVPLLMWALGWTLPQAVPVALLAVCVAATFGTVAAWDVSFVRYRAAVLMGATGIVFAFLGLHTAATVPLQALSLLFAAVQIVVATRMLLQARRMPQEASVVRAALVVDRTPARGPLCRRHPDTGRFVWTHLCALALAGAGALTGFLTGLLGVGGGFVLVPTLRAFTDLSMHSAVATSLMTIALTSAGGVALAIVRDHDLPWLLALPFAAGALIGMLAGRLTAPRIAGARLQQGFAALMLAVAVGMIAHALQAA
jgi:uncharacterized membrane protein YfcA